MPSQIDNYEFLGTLGSGATGTVKLAYQPELDRHVAIKEFSPTLVGDPYFLQRFRNEAQLMTRLDSPNCVTVHDFLEEPGGAWLVSEYVEGASLRKILDRSGFLSPEQALGVVKGAVIGLGYGHSLGLVHRDIKPANVLVNREGLAKLGDFGQALFSPGPGAAGGIPAGTPAYMSPEQVTGGTVDYRSDIYSCGAILFECLTGKTPFHADNALAMMRMHVSDPVPDPRALNTSLPQGVAEMVMRAMAKDAADRQSTAFQFLADLEQAAVAGYGEDWQRRSSIKSLVGAIVAAGGIPLIAEGAAPPAGGDTGGPILAGGDGEWWRNKWLIAGGAVGAILLIFGIAFVFGAMGGNKNSTPVATASPFPSPSPTPDVSPSPSSSPSPSPSPSSSPSPSPKISPPPAPPPIVISAASIWYETCNPICGMPPSDGSAYADMTAPLSGSCGATRHLKFFEQYTWADPGPGGPSSVPITVHWQGVYPGGVLEPGTSYPGDTASPGGGGTHHANTPPGYDDMGMSTKPPGKGYVYFNLTWTNPDGKPGGISSTRFYYKC